MNSQVTLCLTMGKRPDLLKQTLNSLFSFQQFDHVIAINDFGDEETNRAFKDVCPHGHLIDLGKQVGHHRAVDSLYELVKTPYVLHCEDDWLFTQSPDISQAIHLMKSEKISSVCFRSISDFKFDRESERKIEVCCFDSIDYISLLALHPQWYGYTFNPHIASIDLWRNLGGFTQFKKERHVSRHLRGLNLAVAFSSPGVCEHIGDCVSVANPPDKKTLVKTIKHLQTWVQTMIFRDK